MESKRPRGREKNVTGTGKTVEKRGEGLHTGPVGQSGGYNGRSAASQSGGSRSGGTRAGGGMKLLILLAALLLGGGGGLSALLGQPGQAPSTNQPPQSVQQQPSQSSPDMGLDLSSLLGSLGGGSVSTGWQGAANTSRLDTTVDPSARAKYTKLRGNGQDTATIMVYMCGTDLESRSGMGTADLQEMLAAGFGNRVNLLVYTGGCTGWRNNQVSSATNQIWQIRDGSLVCLEKDLGSVPMTDPATLTGFIQYCVRRCPANRYELILWDHGGGSISGYGYDQKFASSGSMGLAGIDKALTDAKTKFDFIGFDACLMATAENALTLTKHADYLIASEETEPGVGWYYTNWLTEFGKNPSMPTIELGRKIADDFVDVCAQKCAGQLTTLSVIDLAELEATLPEALTKFSKAACDLISSQQYQLLADARGNTREFAQSSRIDHVDLVHLARNLDSKESGALEDALLGAVKYNRTSSNMTNAFGISIYFPYQKVSSVDSAVSAYRQIGMDQEYIDCIRAFASLEASGQAVSGGTASPLPSLLGALGGSGGSSELISELLGSFLGGGFDSISGLNGGNTGFLSGKALSDEETVQYLEEHCFNPNNLVWTAGVDGTTVMQLRPEQWKLVQTLELNLFYDDGEGFLDLGLDTVFDFDGEGNLLGVNDGTWLAINEQPVAYYHTATVDDGENYTITGRVPVMLNGERAELLLTFDNETPYGYVAGARRVYTEGETETVAKSDTALQPGDTLEFLCDYYGYDGSYQDSYLLGDPVTVTEEPLAISNVPLLGSTQATYRFTDIFNQSYWTPVIP
ncbi:MAG: peptidase C11 [Oscillospiraceae bacterium]|nr:peptidase C11 [Oscillospiraceae bacterium]